MAKKRMTNQAKCVFRKIMKVASKPGFKLRSPGQLRKMIRDAKEDCKK